MRNMFYDGLEVYHIPLSIAHFYDASQPAGSLSSAYGTYLARLRSGRRPLDGAVGNPYSNPHIQAGSPAVTAGSSLQMRLRRFPYVAGLHRVRFARMGAARPTQGIGPL